EEAHHLAPADLEAQAVHRDEGAVHLGHPVDNDHGPSTRELPNDERRTESTTRCGARPDLSVQRPAPTRRVVYPVEPTDGRSRPARLCSTPDCSGRSCPADCFPDFLS